ncbi:MAG: DNA-directed RNA polymerase subunit omega [Candidatus Krumholzibacteriales bacterium]
MDVKLMEDLLDKVDNRYEGVMVVAEEAARINAIIRLSGEEVSEKPTTIALRRVAEGKVKYKYEEKREEE